MKKFDKFNCGIYKIVSPSKKEYIGSSKDLKHRWSKHLSLLKRNKHYNPMLQNAWNKYNGNLIFKILLICEPKDLLFYEQLCFDNFKPKYNIKPIAGHPGLGRKLPPETIEKMRKSHLGIKHTEETKIKIGNFHRGEKWWIWTEEQKQERSRLFKGRSQPEGTRLSHIGRKCSPETIQKMREAGLRRYGKL